VSAEGKSNLSFRTKLFVTMMLVVSGITILTLYFAENRAADSFERELKGEFQNSLAAMHQAQLIWHTAIMERCRVLARNPRIHAALEDNALDLLYPSAREELQEIVLARESGVGGGDQQSLRAKFYRFLDREGRVITPPSEIDAGPLTSREESLLALPHAPATPQLGYLPLDKATDDDIFEIIALPIISTETGEVIAGLVLGFTPMNLGNTEPSAIRSGIQIAQRLHLPALSASGRNALTQTLVTLRVDQPDRNGLRVEIDGVSCLVFQQLLNRDSLYPPAQEVCLYQTARLVQRQHELRWKIIGGGVLSLGLALLISSFVAARLSSPVEKLAHDSVENFELRQQAEAALATTNRELHRSIRFSADASHQLKTPVAVLRAGLEELLAKRHLTPEQCDELDSLVHQTYRLSSVIEDLLLLSRMEAGRLKIEFAPVNLSHLLDGWLDDFGALPDPLSLTVETEIPPNVYIAGEKRYITLILQNLLENARKYNRTHGRIQVSVLPEGNRVRLTIGNTGRAIPVSAQEHIFERFHRGTIGEDIPGHGLGLNLAQELARLHQGDLRLVRSENDWTEFEILFRSTTEEHAT
jgi:signal transduction histidine kinase